MPIGIGSRDRLAVSIRIDFSSLMLSEDSEQSRLIGIGN